MKEIDVAFTVCIYCRMLLNFRVFFFCVSILIDLSHIMCNNDVTPLLYCHTNRSLIFGAVGRLDRDALQRFTIYGLGFIWLFKQADRALRGRSKDHKGTYLTRRMKYCTLKKTKKKVRTSGRKIICEYRSKRAGLLTWLEMVIMGREWALSQSAAQHTYRSTWEFEKWLKLYKHGGRINVMLVLSDQIVEPCRSVHLREASSISALLESDSWQTDINSN